MSIFCSLIREECNTFHSQSTVKTLESASQLPYRHTEKVYYLKGEFLYEQRSIICQDLRAGPQDRQGAGQLHQRRTGKGSIRRAGSEQ